MRQIIGTHMIIYSRKPEADRAFLRDVLGLSHVDVGEGWLIFSLPPAELAVHPSRKNNKHEIYLMCTDIRAFVKAVKKKGVSCGPVQRLSWGNWTQVKLPGGGKLGVYQPLHVRPKATRRGAATKPRRLIKRK